MAHAARPEPAATAPRPARLLSCRPCSFGRFADRAFAELPALGITHVEISAPARGGIAATDATLRAHGLRASAVCLERKLAEPDFLDAARAAVDAAPTLGARIVFTSQTSGGLPLAEAYARIHAAAEIARAGGVTLALETHPDLAANAAEMLATLRAVAHPALGINFDPANVSYYNHDGDAARELAQVAPHVRSLHVKDTEGGYRSWRFPAIGDGVVAWDRVFALLDAQGFSGPCTLELEGVKGEELTLDETRARIARSLAYLRDRGHLP